jgi:RimJ/RimL family protein N-acetyltransferase
MDFKRTTDNQVVQNTNHITFDDQKDCSKVKAITRPTNLESIAFHKSIGMELTGDGIFDGIPVVFDYGGPGEHRVVIVKDI